VEIKFQLDATEVFIADLIANSRILYGGCCLWYFVLWFSSCWSGVELRVMCPVFSSSTCFGHHYAHHQGLKNIIQWLLPVVFRAVVFELLVWCGDEGYVSGLQQLSMFRAPLCPSSPDQQLENHSTKYHRQQPPYNILELLIMGIVVPETC